MTYEPTRAPTLFTTVNVAWECPRGYDHDVEVEVEFSFDGDKDLQILSARTLSEGEITGISDHDFDELVDEAVFECAHDEYHNWLSGQDGSED